VVVAVVEIGIVRMGMRQGQMRMDVGMGLTFRIVRSMGMLVMRVVAMPMLVGKQFMGMQMCMALCEMQPDT
jgi:hypothetical protein